MKAVELDLQLRGGAAPADTRLPGAIVCRALPEVPVAHGLPADRAIRHLVAREHHGLLMVAPGLMPLAHQAPRPIRAAQVPGAVDLLVHDAGSPGIAPTNRPPRGAAHRL